MVIQYDKNSIVDTLKSQGIDSSFSNRTKIANQYGINNYTGTAEQNISLLNILKGNTSNTLASSKFGAQEHNLQGNIINDLTGNQGFNNQINYTNNANPNKDNQQQPQQPTQPTQPAQQAQPAQPFQDATTDAYDNKTALFSSEATYNQSLIQDNQSKLAELQNTSSYLNDPSYQREIANISGEYNNLIQKQQRVNQIEQGIASIYGITNNAENAGIGFQVGYNEIIQKGFDKILDLERKRDAEIERVKAEYRKANNSEVNRILERIEKAQQEKNKALQDVQDNIIARSKYIDSVIKTQIQQEKDKKKQDLDDIEANFDPAQLTKKGFAELKKLYPYLDDATISGALQKGRSKYDKEQLAISREERAIEASNRAQRQLELSEARFNKSQKEEEKNNYSSDEYVNVISQNIKDYKNSNTNPSNEAIDSSIKKYLYNLETKKQAEVLLGLLDKGEITKEFVKNNFPVANDIITSKKLDLGIKNENYKQEQIKTIEDEDN